MYTEEGMKLLIFHVQKRAAEDYMSDIRKLRRLGKMYIADFNRSLLWEARLVIHDAELCENWLPEKIIEACRQKACWDECRYFIEEAKNEFKTI